MDHTQMSHIPSAGSIALSWALEYSVSENNTSAAVEILLRYDKLYSTILLTERKLDLCLPPASPNSCLCVRLYIDTKVPQSSLVGSILYSVPLFYRIIRQQYRAATSRSTTLCASHSPTPNARLYMYMYYR